MGDAEMKRFLVEQKSKCEQLLKEGKSNFVFCANNCLMNNVLSEIRYVFIETNALSYIFTS